MDGRFFTNCVRNIIENAVSICVIIPQNRKVRKVSTSHYRSKFRAQRYGDKLPKKVGKPEGQKAVHTSCKHGVGRICKLYTKRGPAGKLTWCEPLETIWIIVDETTYKDPAPNTVDEIRQWLRFAWKNVTLDPLWELVHSIPHCLENVRNIQEDILFTNILVIQC